MSPENEQISYKVYLMMFNVVNGTAPTYMTGMVTRISDLPGRCHLGSAAEGLFDVPCTRTVFGSRAFSISGPVAWNGLLPMFEPFPTLSHLNQHSKLIFSISLRYFP